QLRIHGSTGASRREGIGSVDAVRGDGRRLQPDLVGLATPVDLELAVPLILVGTAFPDHALLGGVVGPLALARRLVAGKIGLVLVTRQHHRAEIDRRIADPAVAHDAVLAIARTRVGSARGGRAKRDAKGTEQEGDVADHDGHHRTRPTAAEVGNTSDLITTGTAPEAGSSAPMSMKSNSLRAMPSIEITGLRMRASSWQ